MLSNADVPFLTVIAERPRDKIAWQHYAQWLAERGEIEVSVWLLRDWDLMPNLLRAGWGHISEFRYAAGLVGEYALMIVDYLLPHFRWPGTLAHAIENIAELAPLMAEPPPLPRRRTT